MTTLIFLLVSVLLVVVIITIFRVSALIRILRGDSKSNIPKSNTIHAVLLLLFMIVGILAFFYYSFFGGVDDYTHDIASEHGVVTENLFWITMAITVFVFIVTQIFLFGFSYLYRYQKNRRADFYPHNNKLEMIWTVIPAIVLALLIFSGLKAWNKVTGPAPEDAEIVEVMGYQYAWSFRYGGNVNGQLGKYDYKKIDVVNQMGIDFTDKRNFDDFISNQLIIPKGKPIELKIRSRDVIHSVYNPNFRLQMNAVPGHPTRFWFVPTKTTQEMRQITGNPEFNYELVCNKICGGNHFGMKAVIQVLEQDEYQEWYKKQGAWLQSNPEYLDKVPKELKAQAIKSADISITEDENQKVDIAKNDNSNQQEIKL